MDYNSWSIICSFLSLEINKLYEIVSVFAYSYLFLAVQTLEQYLDLILLKENKK